MSRGIHTASKKRMISNGKSHVGNLPRTSDTGQDVAFLRAFRVRNSNSSNS